MTTYGVIGYGSFGKLLIDLIPESDEVLLATSQKPVNLPTNVKIAQTEELAAKCEVIFLSIPLSAYGSVAEKLKNNLNKEALIVDVASVKVKPEKMLPELLPEHNNFLFTHPLFGPQSVTDSNLSGLKLIVTKKDGRYSNDVIELFTKLGAEVVYMTADEHDRQMAFTHSLTFFISHALAIMDIKEVELSAPSYATLLALKNLDHNHSSDLFETIQSGNPYSYETRHKFIETLIAIDKKVHDRK